MDEYYRAVRALPAWLARPLSALPPDTAEQVHEIRLRVGCGVQLTIGGKPCCPAELPALQTLRLTPLQMEEIFVTLCGGSVHSHETEIAAGYVTLSCGCRAGLAGQFYCAPGQSASGSESETAGVLPALLPQRDTGHLPDANAADAVKATVNFQSGGATGFVYDDALAAYGMLHADGTAQLDANTGTQAVFDNLLILYSGSSLRDDGHTLDYDLSMGGGVWLNGGHLWQVTWTQGVESTLALYDSNGKPLELPAGRSYIALLSSLTGQELLVQSSTGEALVGAG